MNAFWLLIACGAQLAAVNCVTYVKLDLADVDTNAFVKTADGDTRYTITLKNDIAIEDIVNGQALVAQAQVEQWFVKRVTVERLPQDACEDRNVLPKLTRKGEFEVVGIDGLHFGVPVRRRLVMDEQGVYVDLDDAYVDFDICSDDIDGFDKLSARTADGLLTRYDATDFRHLGEITCGDTVLMRGSNAIYTRYAEVVNHRWTIHTTPYVGNSFKTEFIPTTGSECRYRRVDEGSMVLDLSLNPNLSYRDVVSGCGEKCIFFDGCSKEAFRIVDVIDQHGVIYVGHKAKCIDVKVQTLGDETFLTIYAKLTDGTHQSFWYISKNGGPYVSHRPKAVNLELTSSKWDKHITMTMEGEAKVFSIPSPTNLKWTIGAVTYNGKPLVGKAFLKDPDNVPYVVIGRRIVVEDEFTTIETETDRDYPAKTTYFTNEDGVWLYRPRPIQLDLSKLSPSNPYFHVKQIDEFRHHITVSKARTKIGTIRLGRHVIRANQYHILGTQLVYGENTLLMTTQVGDELKFYTTYVLNNGVFGEETQLFIEQHKEPVHLALEDLFTDRLPDALCREQYGNYQKIFLCKSMFRNIMGAVSFGDSVVAPFSRYYELREVYVSTDFFLSSVIVKSYTSEGECVIEPFTYSVVDDKMKIVRVPKKPITIDISDDFDPPQELSKVQDDNVFFYRIKDEYAVYYRIGDIIYGDNLLLRDNKTGVHREVNVLLDPSGRAAQTYTIRVADVTAYARHSMLLVTDGVSGVVADAKKRSLTLDVSFDVARDVSVMMKQHNGVVSFYIPWTRVCDYSLDKLVITHKGNTDVITTGAQFNRFPEVRLHWDHSERVVVAAVSASGEEPLYTKIKQGTSGSALVMEVCDRYPRDMHFLENHGDA